MEDHPYFHEESPHRGLNMENPAGPCHIALRAPLSSSLRMNAHEDSAQSSSLSCKSVRGVVGSKRR